MTHSSLILTFNIKIVAPTGSLLGRLGEFVMCISHMHMDNWD